MIDKTGNIRKGEKMYKINSIQFQGISKQSDVVARSVNWTSSGTHAPAHVMYDVISRCR